MSMVRYMLNITVYLYFEIEVHENIRLTII